MVTTTVRPPPAAMRRSVPTILAAVVESSPEVGSSRRRRLGSTSISSPMLTRFRSPPDSPRTPRTPPIMLCATLPSPSSSITSSACARFSPAPSARGRRSSAVYQSVSATVRWG
ncbi:Os08g0167166 [Oryza sativa Japonica Group]|uniref:Os08g0167166 protein n=1 Tax=Oryza sativa subsp. japonica TaxID=39947 RepID=A0A0P0XC39_ORYSJ|nr:hypothetical protein EE612_042323 [Oryza sativa]BAT03992.1 Os08g0167166 [Oryza sativa Japonica Group]